MCSDLHVQIPSSAIPWFLKPVADISRISSSTLFITSADRCNARDGSSLLCRARPCVCVCACVSVNCATQPGHPFVTPRLCSVCVCVGRRYINLSRSTCGRRWVGSGWSSVTVRHAVHPYTTSSIHASNCQRLHPTPLFHVQFAVITVKVNRSDVIFLHLKIVSTRRQPISEPGPRFAHDAEDLRLLSNLYKKFELMLTRHAKVRSNSCSETVSLSPAISSQFILRMCAAAEDRKNQ